FSNGSNKKLLDYIVYESSHELLQRLMILMTSINNEELEIVYDVIKYIVDYCQEHLSENALVLKNKEFLKTVVPKNNHLQKPPEREEEHQDGKVEEYYEVFLYKGSPGKILKVIYKSLTPSLQLHKETCSPHLVHHPSLESE
ncbi:hypothetical protein JBE27_56285, partial [Streptomyces albiflaviniger]|nr:hypothetical protein [Streptomyces albiflaviniger]